MTEKDYFKAVAMPDADWWQALWPDPEAVLSALGITADMTVVDLCCGDGYFTAPMCRLAAPATGYAIDLDPDMLDRTRGRLRENGISNAVLIEADARALSGLVSEKAAFVLIANTFHGVPDQTGLSRGVAEILAPQGRFAVVNWHARPREETPVLGQPRGPATELRMTPDATAAVVEKAGFLPDSIIELPPYHYGAVFRKTNG
ncbi:MAG: class I SAM-dependent methyltransferase [Rhodospirillales bacterium]|nr:class I SAM-dependent methyltransferase [Alphaproteobacteria bacterium]MBL6947188.1 class I SAM-dependent methyltransferase [Rhodospirillales bacterium]